MLRIFLLHNYLVDDLTLVLLFSGLVIFSMNYFLVESSVRFLIHSVKFKWTFHPSDFYKLYVSY